MNIILFDTEARKKLIPLTLTKAVADIRMGILTIRERWEKLTNAKIYILTAPYLQQLYEPVPPGEYIFVDSSLIPNAELIHQIFKLQPGESFTDENGLIAGRAAIGSLPGIESISDIFPSVTSLAFVRRLEWPNQLFQWNEEFLRFDFELVTKSRISAAVDKAVHVVNSTNIFIEEGATVEFASLNASAGPVYIGKNAKVMEGCLIRGPFALCEGAVLKMGSKVYGATIGPFCTAGGEIRNSVMFGFSNKAHDGYLGDSVIGEWCNLGAGTSNSNVKNTGGKVKLWNYFLQKYVVTGNKCGFVMGDYSRTAINSSINTGTIIGVCSNVFGEGLSPKVIPDFSWGADNQTRYNFDKALIDIANWKKMKNKTLGESEKSVLKHIFDHLTQ